MLTLRTQSVNVNRLDLITALKKGREQHLAAYNEALADYKDRTIEFLKTALANAQAGDLSNVKLTFNPPMLHLSDYDNVIEMMDLSVDETINLDTDAFKAYFKNEWPWTNSFALAAASYKA